MRKFITVARAKGRIIGVSHSMDYSAEAAVRSHLVQYGSRTDVTVTVLVNA